MKHHLILVMLMITTGRIYSQKPVHKARLDTTPIKVVKLSGILAKDSLQQAYEKEMLAVVKNASGSNTNAAAARAVYEKYKDKIQPASPSEPVAQTEENGAGISGLEYSNKTNLFLKKFSKLDRLQGTVYPAYSSKWSQHWKWYLAQGELPPLREFNTDLSKGRIGFTADIRDKDNGIGKAFVGFRQRVRIPADPEVIAASFTFHYSFLHTGWENPGARFSLELWVHAPADFNSTNYLELPKQSDPHFLGFNDWRRAHVLVPWTIMATGQGVQEFHTSIDSSFTLVGYVRPGTSFDLYLGAGYILTSMMSSMGGYHYGEFILKSIEVKFLKTLQSN